MVKRLGNRRCRDHGRGMMRRDAGRTIRVVTPVGVAVERRSGEKDKNKDQEKRRPETHRRPVSKARHGASDPPCFSSHGIPFPGDAGRFGGWSRFILPQEPPRRERRAPHGPMPMRSPGLEVPLLIEHRFRSPGAAEFGWAAGSFPGRSEPHFLACAKVSATCAQWIVFHHASMYSARRF